MHDVRERVYPSGITAVWSADADAEAFARALAPVASRNAYALCLTWFSPTRHDGGALAAALAGAVPGLEVAGCSTSGEVTPDGLQSGGLLAVLLPAAHFDVHVSLIEDIERRGMDEIDRHARAALVAAESAAFAADVEALDSGATPRPPPSADDTFALAMMDGTTFAEEATAVALQRGLGDVVLIGGSAGDDLRFERTEQLHGGRAHRRAAVLVLVRSRLPFRLFNDNNFVPTSTKLVVTSADADRRVVHELDAEPAAAAYAAAIGTVPERLDAETFAANALVVRIGGRYYSRSVHRANADGSLSFFCAVDNGLVLTVARSEGMVRATRSAFDGIEADMGPIDCIVGFDCVYRRLGAAARGATARMEALLSERRFVGFNGHGEQYRSMHVNQTVTGVAFGVAPT